MYISVQYIVAVVALVFALCVLFVRVVRSLELRLSLAELHANTHILLQGQERQHLNEVQHQHEKLSGYKKPVFNLKHYHVTVKSHEPGSGMDDRCTIPAVSEWMHVSDRPLNTTSTFSFKRAANKQSDNKPTDVVFLMLPGNPGLVDYYRLFLQYLYELHYDSEGGAAVQYKFHFHCPSYLGHTTKSLNKGRLFSFQQQIEYIQHFITDLVKMYGSDTKFVVMGHSVGAYIVLKNLHLIPERQLLKVILLFPTIFEIGSSPNGVTMTPLLTYIRVPFCFLAKYIFLLMPHAVKKYLIYRHIGLYPTEINASLSLINLLNGALPNSLNMAYHEMMELKQLPDNFATRLSNIHLIWGTTDGWAPLSYLQQLRDQFPNVSYEIAPDEIQHAFVIGGAATVAKMVHQQVQSALQEQESRR